MVWTSTEVRCRSQVRETLFFNAIKRTEVLITSRSWDPCFVKFYGRLFLPVVAVSAAALLPSLHHGLASKTCSPTRNKHLQTQTFVPETSISISTKTYHTIRYQFMPLAHVTYRSLHKDTRFLQLPLARDTYNHSLKMHFLPGISSKMKEKPIKTPQLASTTLPFAPSITAGQTPSLTNMQLARSELTPISHYFADPLKIHSKRQDKTLSALGFTTRTRLSRLRQPSRARRLVHADLPGAHLHLPLQHIEEAVPPRSNPVRALHLAEHGCKHQKIPGLQHSAADKQLCSFGRAHQRLHRSKVPPARWRLSSSFCLSRHLRR